ncbi:MAG TPA: hypothetical protein VJ912_04320 [Candidatus Nanoarchaeia archaeon]|nr:hypothetical protein [Candidatus Nanoarchaeia archaeon]
MKKFNSKKEIFDYIKEKYSNADSIIVRGSSPKRKLKEFDDIDVDFLQDKPAKPEYELVSLNGKLILITAYPYKAGKKINNVPKGVKVLKGDYCKTIENQKPYTKKEKYKRDNQMFMDIMFKYLRKRDKSLLDDLDKYTQF